MKLNYVIKISLLSISFIIIFNYLNNVVFNNDYIYDLNGGWSVQSQNNGIIIYNLFQI